MTPRVKLLAFGLLGILIVYVLGGPIVTAVIGPLNMLDSKARKLADDIQKQEATKLKIARATRDLREWKVRSLPPDKIVAGTLYQAWLMQLAEKHKLTQVTVSRGGDTRAKADTYASIPATVKAEGTMKQVCDFLYDFHASGLLHRVNSITATTMKHQGDPTLDVTINVEGLAMMGAEPRTTLESPNLQKIALRDRKDYDTLSTKNLFVRGYNGPPAPPRQVERPPPVAPSPPAPPPFDPTEFTRLIGSVSVDGQRGAWLYDQSSNVRTDLTEGGRFKVASLEGQVLAISDDFVQLQVGRDTFHLELGQSLKEMRKIATVAPAPASEPAPMPAATPEAKPAEAAPTTSATTQQIEPAKSATETPAENTKESTPKAGG